MAAKAFRTPGTGGKRDETGLLSVVVPFYVDDEADAIAVGVNAPYGLKEVGRTWTDVEGLSGFSVQVTYEGFEDGRDEHDGESIEFDPSFSEEPITSHANWLNIKAAGGGTVDKAGKVTWPETVIGPAPEPLKVDDPLDDKNPMFGVQTYFALKSVFRRTYTVRELPNDILDEIGGIVEELPNGLPTPDGRNWLQLPPKISLRGNAYQISEELILSPVGGKWPESVYEFITV